DKELAEELVDIYKLPRKAKTKALSKGMASALGIIVGLASKAPVTIFDEPYIGLDAAGRKRFDDILLEEYEAHPRTFIFSTHLINIVSFLFEEVIIVQDGIINMQESAETMGKKAVYVIEEKEALEQFIDGKQVINMKKLANMMTAYIYGVNDQPED